MTVPCNRGGVGLDDPEAVFATPRFGHGVCHVCQLRVKLPQTGLFLPETVERPN